MNDSAAPTQRGGAIELHGVTKLYGGMRAVDSIDLSIKPGEFFSLLGPSGSGKTTTLMMIAGFASVDEGRIEISGIDVAQKPPQERGFGMVFQNYAIFPHLNIFENVAFPLRARRQPEAKIRERVEWALNLVQLGGFAERFSRQLSGGQQQRVAIARAIVFEPKVVLMDEPLGALDKNLRYDMQIEIKEIQRRLGMTVVYVTHDQEEAMNMSDRIAIVNKGRIEQVGAPTGVYETPCNRFVARFLGEANILDGAIISADATAAKLQAAGRVLHGSCSEPVTTGQSAALFVRPERVFLDDGSNPTDDALNRLSGRVVHASFLGNMIRYQIEVSPGVTMLVDAQNIGGAPRTPGSTVTLRWSASDSLLLGS
jgi:spermidine/putrescine ABC transporter ATP-binding subunit